MSASPENAPPVFAEPVSDRAPGGAPNPADNPPVEDGGSSTNPAGDVTQPDYRTVGFPKSRSFSVSSRNQKELRKTGSENRPGSRVRSRSKKKTERYRRLPKRPKGRWFISTIILIFGFLIASAVWNEFFRFSARGVVEGRVIEVRAPWEGVVQTLHVRDGEQVEQGQLLATMHNHELANQQKTLKAELQIALATLSTRVAEIQAEAQSSENATVRLSVEYYQLLGRHYADKAKLKELEDTLARSKTLARKRSVSESRLTQARLAAEGQRQVVDEQLRAIEALERKIADEPDSTELYQQRLSSALMRISNAEEELQRMEELEQLGEIRAPVSGKVIRRHHFTGEYLTNSEMLFEVLEEGSLKAVIYVPQRSADEIQAGSTVDLMIAPTNRLLSFEIQRVSDEMRFAPEQIKRYYRQDQKLVPMYATPADGVWMKQESRDLAWLGAEIRVPRFASGEVVAIEVLHRVGGWIAGREPKNQAW